MNAEKRCSVLSALAKRDPRERRCLHSRGYNLLLRGVAVSLTLGIARVFGFDGAAAAERGVARAILEVTLRVVLLIALVLWLWLRARSVIATGNGLELGSGRQRRLIAWKTVVDVREMPWICFSARWYPKRFQVDLEGGDAFDFVGLRRSKENVIEYAARSARCAEMKR